MNKKKSSRSLIGRQDNSVQFSVYVSANQNTFSRALFMSGNRHIQ